MKNIIILRQIIFWSVILSYICMSHSCKKYDENMILFAQPEKVLAKLSGAHIVYCKENGIDSTSNMLRILPTYTNSEFHFMPYKNDISVGSSDYFNCIIKVNGKDVYYRFYLSKNMKEISISALFDSINRYLPVQPLYQLSMPKFYIKRLTTKDMKLITNFNNKEYEIYMSK